MIIQLQALHPLSVEDASILVSQVSKYVKQIISPDRLLIVVSYLGRLRLRENGPHPSFQVYHGAGHFVFVEGTQI